MNMFLPKGIKNAVKLDKLYKVNEKEKLLLSERLSSRMVKSASVLSEGEYVGWQLIVPKKGLVNMAAYGTMEVSESDLKWMTEKIAEAAKYSSRGAVDKVLSELYELYLPIAESSGTSAEIGFGAAKARSDDGFSKWPAYYSSQFPEMIKAFRETGAALRIVAGPASEEELLACRKSTLRTYDVNSINSKDYIGRPVKIRALLRLPGPPSVRLKTVLEEAVQGVKLRCIGKMEEPESEELWNNPVNGSSILPDYAARIMILEPEIYEPIIGIELCEHKLKY